MKSNIYSSSDLENSIQVIRLIWMFSTSQGFQINWKWKSPTYLCRVSNVTADDRWLLKVKHLGITDSHSLALYRYVKKIFQSWMNHVLILNICHGPIVELITLCCGQPYFHVMVVFIESSWALFVDYLVGSLTF